MRPFALLIWLSAFVAAAGHSAAAAPDRGAQVAAVCASCHRLDGEDRGIPSIVGIDPMKLIGKIHEFKSNDSPAHSMHTLSLSLSDDEIAAVAQYLGARGMEARSP
jgi:cytochrome c553